MEKISINKLKNQNESALKSTYYYSPRVSPSISRNEEENIIIVKTIDDLLKITKKEEIVLQIISDFKFSPYWLVVDWLEQMGDSKEEAEKIIDNMIKVGIIWTEVSSTGAYLRPTKYLFDMFNEQVTPYTPIPYNTLTHTLAEQKLCFEIQSGVSCVTNDILEEYTLLPHYSPLKIKSTKGTIAIREGNFRGKLRFENKREIDKSESEIEEQIKRGEKFTNEFQDFEKFPIFYIKRDGEYANQIPDVIIPIQRNEDGSPNSIALEVELSAKSIKRYEEILNAYKDNNKFGTLIYLCDSSIISNRVRNVYDKMGGLGKTKLILTEFHPPEIDINYYFKRGIVNMREIPKKRKLNIIKKDKN